MRPLTFGVLLSVGPVKGAPELDPARLQDGDRQIEAHVDLRSASDLVAALRAQGHKALALGADEDLDLTLRECELDACLLALHGRRGGHGDVQSLLELRQIPYFGAPSGAVSLAFDKVRARKMLAYHNVPVLPAVALGRGLEARERALALLGWPCVVKPRRGALGLGVAPLQDVTEVGQFIERALDLDDQILLERMARGVEVQVVLLGERVLGAVELETDEAGHVGQICPPRIPRGRLDGVYHLARRAVTALGLHEGLSRVDIMTCDRGNEAILEVEPLPPLSQDGVVARVARAAGLGYEALVRELTDRLILRVPTARVIPPGVFLQ